MRLLACLAFVLLATCACAQLPQRVRVEAGDRAVEVEGRCPQILLPDDWR